MLIIAYIFLTVSILLHAVYSLRNLLKRPRPAWDYDKQAVLVFIMLLLIAVTNAAAVLAPNLAPTPNEILRVFFGQGRTEGILQLGAAGLYWAAVFIFSGVMRVKYPMSKHLERVPVKLPPGGVITLILYVVTLILLLALIVWGTT